MAYYPSPIFGKFAERSHPPRHTIKPGSCQWKWEGGWDDDDNKLPHRVCSCKPPSRAELFGHILDNYVDLGNTSTRPDGETYTNLCNWSLVCVDWAEAVRPRMFTDKEIRFDWESDWASMRKSLQLQARQPRFVSSLRYVRGRVMRKFYCYLKSQI